VNIRPSSGCDYRTAAVRDGYLRAIGIPHSIPAERRPRSPSAVAHTGRAIEVGTDDLALGAEGEHYIGAPFDAGTDPVPLGKADQPSW
jgi:hypothetical protein